MGDTSPTNGSSEHRLVQLLRAFKKNPVPLAAAAMVLILYGSRAAYDTSRWDRQGVETRGVLVEDSRSFGDNDPEAPVRYTTESGEEYIRELVVSGKEGSTMSVWYIRNDPGHAAHIDRSGASWFAFLIVSAGVVLLVIALGLYVERWLSKPP